MKRLWHVITESGTNTMFSEAELEAFLARWCRGPEAMFPKHVVTMAELSDEDFQHAWNILHLGV